MTSNNVSHLSIIAVAVLIAFSLSACRVAAGVLIQRLKMARPRAGVPAVAVQAVVVAVQVAAVLAVVAPAAGQPPATQEITSSAMRVKRSLA